jgi:hypothetical protein
MFMLKRHRDPIELRLRQHLVAPAATKQLLLVSSREIGSRLCRRGAPAEPAFRD